MRRTAIGLLVAGGLFLAFGASAWAHHSMTAYDKTKTFAIEGTVTKVSWRNPHMLIFIDVPDASGKMVNWSLESGAVNSAAAAGITPKNLKVGIKIKATGNRHRDPAISMAIIQTVEIDGVVHGRNAGVSSTGSDQDF